VSRKRQYWSMRDCAGAGRWAGACVIVRESSSSCACVRDVATYEQGQEQAKQSKAGAMIGHGHVHGRRGG
jgi:hypothetical protein